jgi:hypothetical protein
MRFFSKAKDGGSDSPVDAFFLFEIKSLGSIALLRFNQGGREAFHSHAFNAYTWFLSGILCEEFMDGKGCFYQRRLKPKFTARGTVHRVVAIETSWCFTIRGPWVDQWYEWSKAKNTMTEFTHGRKVRWQESLS